MHTASTRFQIPVLAALLVACAPMMSSPPSTPMRSVANGEINHGFNAGAIHEQGLNPNSDRRGWEGLGNYHLSIRMPNTVNPNKEFGGLFQAGWRSIFSGGGYYRTKLVGGERTYIGGQASMGWIWAGLALPAAFEVAEGKWLTTQPSVTVGAYAVMITRIPLGMGFEVGEYNRIDTEVGAMLLGKAENPGLGKTYSGYVGIHFSQQLGRTKTTPLSSE